MRFACGQLWSWQGDGLAYLYLVVRPPRDVEKWDAPDEDGTSWQLPPVEHVELLNLETGEVRDFNTPGILGSRRWAPFEP